MRNCGNRCPGRKRRSLEDRGQCKQSLIERVDRIDRTCTVFTSSVPLRLRTVTEVGQPYLIASSARDIPAMSRCSNFLGKEWKMARFVAMRILFSIAVLAVMLGLAGAQDRWQNAPGQFDYYVLSLSWSPSFCETATGNARRQQCGARPFSFVVHGLWPQYERGFPESCLLPPTIVSVFC